MLCEFEDFAVTSDYLKNEFLRIFTNFKNSVKFANFLKRILNREITNPQSMQFLCVSLYASFFVAVFISDFLFLRYYGV